MRLLFYCHDSNNIANLTARCSTEEDPLDSPFSFNFLMCLFSFRDFNNVEESQSSFRQMLHTNIYKVSARNLLSHRNVEYLLSLNKIFIFC
jgi:hypothetical protein